MVLIFLESCDRPEAPHDVSEVCVARFLEPGAPEVCFRGKGFTRLKVASGEMYHCERVSICRLVVETLRQSSVSMKKIIVMVA